MRDVWERDTCVDNLRVIDWNKEIAALELKLQTGDKIATMVVNAYIRNHKTLTCLSGRIYTYNVIGTSPQWSMTSLFPYSIRLTPEQVESLNQFSEILREKITEPIKKIASKIGEYSKRNKEEIR